MLYNQLLVKALFVLIVNSRCYLGVNYKPTCYSALDKSLYFKSFQDEETAAMKSYQAKRQKIIKQAKEVILTTTFRVLNLKVCHLRCVTMWLYQDA